MTTEYRDESVIYRGMNDASRDERLNLPDAPQPTPATFHPFLAALNQLRAEVAKLERQGLREQLDNLTQMMLRQFLSVMAGEGRVLRG